MVVNAADFESMVPFTGKIMPVMFGPEYTVLSGGSSEGEFNAKAKR